MPWQLVFPLPFLEVNIIWAVLLIGIVTCSISHWKAKAEVLSAQNINLKAELAGGIILLILIGIKILLEHLGVIKF